MLYISTRGKSPSIDFKDTTFAGLASDGGLYIPTRWPSFYDFNNINGSYNDIAYKVIKPFVGDTIKNDNLIQIINKSYKDFSYSEPVSLVNISDRSWLLELYKGPTLAFKDIALQMLANLFDHFLKINEKKITIIAATS